MDLRICVDCAMVHANADWSGIPVENISAVEAGLEQFPFLAVGEPDGFSWSSCDACGSRLGGDRFTACTV